MKKNDNLLSLYRVANYYYCENLSQNEIARLEGTSRSQISRLLIKARDLGIVNISIKLPNNTSLDELSIKLQQSLKISKAIITETSVFESTPETEDDILDDVCTFASAVLPSLLSDCNNIGLGRGRTIYKISLQLPVTKYPEKKMFIPLAGNSGAYYNALQTSAIVNRFSERFCSSAFYLNSPCFHVTGDPVSDYERESLKVLQTHWDNLDSAVFSLGKIEASTLRYFEEIPLDYINPNVLEKACGEIYGQPYYESGDMQLLEEKVKLHYIGMSLDQLKTIKNSICIACGFQKINPIIAAARNGYFNTLITDNLTAEMIIKTVED
jgi:DNA-binding transcriptional regulator LsrR (DeoR family)